MPEYITKAEFTQAKSRLTRALNKAKRENTAKAWRAVIDEVNDTLGRRWADKVWPDDWHRWNIAREDAVYAERRLIAGLDFGKGGWR